MDADIGEQLLDLFSQTLQVIHAQGRPVKEPPPKPRKLRFPPWTFPFNGIRFPGARTAKEARDGKRAL